jgi:hypothetical protein
MFQPTINKGLFTLAALALLPALIGAVLPASNSNSPFIIGCAVSVILWFVVLGFFALCSLIFDFEKEEAPRQGLADDVRREYFAGPEQDRTWQYSETKLVPTIAPGDRGSRGHRLTAVR